MQITKDFTLEELTASQTAARQGIKNAPSRKIIESLTSGCNQILQPLRDKLKTPIIISSGYRSPTLNNAVGGSSSSQHCKGEAADISVNGLTPRQLAKRIYDMGLPFDQLIVEFERWVHISWKTSGTPRKQLLLINAKERRAMGYAELCE